MGNLIKILQTINITKLPNGRAKKKYLIMLNNIKERRDMDKCMHKNLS